MRWTRAIPLILGLLILLLGIFLVSSHGYVAGVYLPSLVGLPDCTTNSNSTSCAELGPFGAAGVGTIVAIAGLGILMAGVRGLASSAASGGTGPTNLPPELLAALASAQARGGTPPGPVGSPTAAPPTDVSRLGNNVVYCTACGKPNPADASFCRSCGRAIAGAPGGPGPSA